jgi:peptide/nickel transport system substrate-binding protein
VATLGGAPKLLHPYPEPQQHTTPRSDAATLIFASLIDLDYERLDWVADPRRSLARELPRLSDGGRTLTFALRDDLVWSDGTPLTSADFLFAWEQARQKENNFVGLSDLERIASYQTPDARTIVVTLKEPLARFLALSAASTIIPVPKHLWQGKAWLDPQANPEMLKPSVVCGPYLPKELTPDRHSYARNPRFWGQQPLLDEVQFVNASPQTVVELFKTRQVEWVQVVPPAQYEQAKALPQAQAVEWVGAVGSYRVLQFNLSRPLLADRALREALSLLVNRDDIVQFEDNLAAPQLGLFTEGSPWRSDGLPRYDHDPARAQQLLAQAGYRQSGGALQTPGGQPVRLEVLWPTTSQPRGKVATYLQQQWKGLGVEATVTGLDFNAFLDKYQRQRDFDVALGSYSASLDPDSAKSQVITGGTQNATGFSSPRVDELVRLGAVEQDEARRKQLYQELERLVVEALPQLYLVTSKNTTIFDRKVGGVRPLKGGDLLRQNNLQVLEWHLTA